MRSLKCFSLLSSALVCAALAATLAGCGSSYDPSFSRRPRFQTSAPLINPKRDPSFLAYAVPETDLHKFPATRSAEFAVHGIDVSKYQGNIDWEQVKEFGRLLRLHQGHGRRRPGRLEIRLQLGGGEGGRRAARRLSLRLLVSPAA